MLERTFGRGLSGSFEALFFPLIANRLNDLIEGESYVARQSGYEQNS